MQERVHRINYDQLGAHSLEPVVKDSQDTFDGEVAGNYRFRIQTRIHEVELFFLLEPSQVPSQAPGVLTHGRGAFLKHNDNAWLTSTGAVKQTLQRHHALAAAGAAVDKRHAPGGQAAA